MKAVIDKDGFVNIERPRSSGGEMTLQECPHSGECGDWCPLFMEPKKMPFYASDTGPVQKVVLQLCRATWEFEPGEFEDLRGRTIT